MGSFPRFLNLFWGNNGPHREERRIRKNPFLTAMAQVLPSSSLSKTREVGCLPSVEASNPTPKHKIPKKHRAFTNFFEKFARTFSFFPVTRVRNPTGIVQKSLFKWTFSFGWISSGGVSSSESGVWNHSNASGGRIVSSTNLYASSLPPQIPHVPPSTFGGFGLTQNRKQPQNIAGVRAGFLNNLCQLSAPKSHNRNR